MYIVPGMKLIPQPLNMACWYASTQMLIHWKMEQRQMSFANLIPPEHDAECAKLRDDNKGINNPQIVAMAKRIGLKAVPPLSPTAGAIEGWLKQYGPLWVNGRRHIVVMAGIMYLPIIGHQVLVYDPWPPTIGKIEWRDLGDWYFNGSSASTRDTSASVEAVFLYCPDDL
ncbi:MAG: hypothetical protein DWQ47_17220 [Acidobacteria bacterium]|nr:MAG: hypothetical protein DWQ32_04620 [Acidobacteriota bacterium]REK02218.1 MAG: hypothetical protein DWQ38_07530 [Acidobacteriota bacterium]REK13979.1 MAG: hypothetical protein DWQ43_10310 [Acidobacteriota bacterium]REK41974.1 MAG: hypothetical protein DWQ47_17220 [Acidobacteriota bacterium]